MDKGEPKVAPKAESLFSTALFALAPDNCQSLADSAGVCLVEGSVPTTAAAVLVVQQRQWHASRANKSSRDWRAAKPAQRTSWRARASVFAVGSQKFALARAEVCFGADTHSR